MVLPGGGRQPERQGAGPAPRCCTRPWPRARCRVIDALIKAGAKLDAVNKDYLTPLLLAEKPEPAAAPGNNADARTYRPKRNTRDEVIAALREAMGLKADDPAPQPPPLPASEQKKNDEKKPDDAEGGRVIKRVLLERRAALGRRGASRRTGAASRRPAPPRHARSRAARGAGAAPRRRQATIDKQKAWVKQYCVTCHNTRNPLPPTIRSTSRRRASRTSRRTPRPGNASCAS
jgi:hypothetical protein